MGWHAAAECEAVVRYHACGLVDYPCIVAQDFVARRYSAIRYVRVREVRYPFIAVAARSVSHRGSPLLLAVARAVTVGECVVRAGNRIVARALVVAEFVRKRAAAAVLSGDAECVLTCVTGAHV